MNLHGGGEDIPLAAVFCLSGNCVSWAWEFNRTRAFRSQNTIQKTGGAAGRMKAERRRERRGFLVVLIAIGLASQPAQAGDRKSTGSVQESAKAVLIASPAQSVTLPPERRDTSAVGLFENGTTADHRSRSDRETGNAPRQHTSLTLFHIHSQLGDIAVQPIMGQVNGAQFTLGFWAKRGCADSLVAR